jgi:hypothetical protein
VVDNGFPVVTIASLCGNPQIFFYESVMFFSVKPPPKTIDEGVVLVTDKELNSREHISLPP